MKPEQWYFRSGDRTEGPHTREEIQSFLQSGHIDDSTLLTRDGDNKWRQAKSYKFPRSNGKAPPVQRSEWIEKGDNHYTKAGHWLPGKVLVWTGYALGLLFLLRGVLGNSRSGLFDMDAIFSGCIFLWMAFILRTLIEIEATLKRGKET